MHIQQANSQKHAYKCREDRAPAKGILMSSKGGGEAGNKRAKPALHQLESNGSHASEVVAAVCQAGRGNSNPVVGKASSYNEDAGIQEGRAVNTSANTKQQWRLPE